MECAYENNRLMMRVCHALRTDLRKGEVLVYRAPFRWMLDAGGHGVVLPNHFESKSIDDLAEEFGYSVRVDFRHVFIATPAVQSYAACFAKEVA